MMISCMQGSSPGQVGDLVLQWVQTNKGKHKLSPPSEQPYLVVKVQRLGHTDSRRSTVRLSPMPKK
jgi:hypothetical protein